MSFGISGIEIIQTTMNGDIYQTIEKESRGFFKDKGSKFYAYAFPVNNEDEIKEILSRLRREHHSARHHCYAWRLGTEEIVFRANDDGEPSSTAGKPILGQLLSFNITNVLLVVVRYFGGTLLGTSGLINAYRSAASNALVNASVIQKTIEKMITVDFSYNQLAEVMNVVKQQNLQVSGIQMEESCNLVVSVRKSDLYKVLQAFGNIYGVTVKNTSD